MYGKGLSLHLIDFASAFRFGNDSNRAGWKKAIINKDWVTATLENQGLLKASTRGFCWRRPPAIASSPGKALQKLGKAMP
jgi:hypothetical protein